MKGPDGIVRLVVILGLIFLVAIGLYQAGGPAVGPRTSARTRARDLLANAQKRGTYLDFLPTVINPISVKAKTLCYNEEVDRLMQMAFENITRVVTRPNIFHEDLTRPSAMEALRQSKEGLSAAELARFANEKVREPDDDFEMPLLESALQRVVTAASLHSHCPVIHTALVALLFRFNRLPQAKEAVDAGIKFFPNHDHLSLLKGLVYEAIGMQGEARTSYSSAIAHNPDIALNFFGVPIDRAHDPAVHPLLLFRDGPPQTSVAGPTNLWALQRLMLAYLYAEDFATGPTLTLNEARAWQKQWYFFVRGYLSPYTAAIARQSYRTLIASGALKFKDPQAIRSASTIRPFYSCS